MLLAKKEEKISVIEAHSLWSILSSKYNEIENVQLWRACAKDLDLKKVLDSFLKDLDVHVKLIEKELQRYSIESPGRPGKYSCLDVNTQIMSDKSIANNYFTYLQEMVQKVLLAIQYSIYNDKVSDFLVKFSRHAIEQTDSILKYLKIKGWIDVSPAYRNIPSGVTEQLDCVEAFHLWAHVNYRYNNIEETMRWRGCVHDLDFKLILDRGLKLMNEQAAKLEKELEHFGITTPQRPPKVVVPDRSEAKYQDESIFKALFIGIQWAGVFHSNAFKTCTTNDRIRDIFKALLYDEMDLVKHISKYGKLKGWLETPPEYTP